VASAPAPKTVGALVASTFQTLYAGPNGPSLDQPAPAAAPPAAAPPAIAASPIPAADPSAADDKGVITRVVNTVVIHADPTTGAIQPTTGTAAPALSAAQPMPVPLAPVPAQPARPPVPAPAPAVLANAVEPSAPVPAVEPVLPAAKPTAAAPPSHHEATAIVGGEGVTIRSGPTMGRGALFSLAAGQKLSVLGKERGWLHITDAKGRAGWVYSGLVSIRN
jgi:hypothetical protein